MSIRVGYMGTKKYLAPHVREIIQQCKDGPVLDVFGGMGAVGESLADLRPVWINDAQIFSTEVGRALFTSTARPPSRADAETLLGEAFNENRQRLTRRFNDAVQLEQEAYRVGTLDAVIETKSTTQMRMTSPFVAHERERMAGNIGQFPYRLFTLGYSGTYFTLGQAIEIDSLRYAIDAELGRKSPVQLRRWFLLALGVAMIRVAATTGHFAQYLNPKQENLQYLVAQGKKSIYEIFLQELAGLGPVGSVPWRRQNKAFNGDAVKLLRRLRLSKERPAVIYADPPYSDDQYSRFYHLWETLIHYDYPEQFGKGGYRPDRFRTHFAIKSKVEAAIEELAKAASALGSDLVISYPADGLLAKIPRSMEDIVRRHYKQCGVAREIVYSHSTMGASKGTAKKTVTEKIFLARN